MKERSDGAAGVEPMIRDAFGPLLRGIGSSLILVGALIGYLGATHHPQGARRPGQIQSTMTAPMKRSPEVGGGEKGNADASDESFAEQVVENPWFESLGFLGAAVVSTSFYVEYLARRRRNN